MSIARRLLVTFGCAALYGGAIGWAHDTLYAERDLLKFPLLIATSAALCSVSFWITALLLRIDVGFVAAQRMAGMLYHDASVLLASLAPVVFFLACVLRATDDGVLGDYDFFLGANMTAIAASGALALLRQVRALRSARPISRARASAVAAVWLALSLLVGGQAAFWMRPFFGYPATRGVRPPFFMGREPDLRGATNFYEAVLQMTTRRALPSDLQERIRKLAR